MTDNMDARVLATLSGTQKCSCCGITPLSPESCDVVDLEIVCLDCMETYYPDVYARRGGDV